MNDEQAIPPFPAEPVPVPGEPLLAPRPSARTATRTGAAFGGLEVGPPVSRLASAPAAGPTTGPVTGPAAGTPSAAPVPAPVPGPERCPSCAARVRPEQDWCSLCHTSLRPAALPAPLAPAAVREVPPVRVLEDEDGQLALDLAPPRAEPAVDEAEVARMLGALARSDRPGPRGLGSRQAKVAVAVGGGLGLTALLLGAMTALGAVLG